MDDNTPKLVPVDKRKALDDAHQKVIERLNALYKMDLQRTMMMINETSGRVDILKDYKPCK